MRLFLHQIKTIVGETNSEFNMISFVFKFLMISSIGLLVFFLTARTHKPGTIDKTNSAPVSIKVGPPAPF